MSFAKISGTDEIIYILSEKISEADVRLLSKLPEQLKKD